MHCANDQHRPSVGLFGTLATSGPATSAQVAEAGGLNERYVREWLNAMTTARFEQGIVRCFREGGGRSYADYPRFHALQAGNNMAVVDTTLPYSPGIPRFRASGHPPSAGAA